MQRIKPKTAGFTIDIPLPPLNKRLWATFRNAPITTVANNPYQRLLHVKDIIAVKNARIVARMITFSILHPLVK